MTQPDDIPTRVTSLEHEMAEVQRKAGDARILASGADRDVSTMQQTLRAHMRAINALRETQVDGFRRMDDRFTQVDANFRQVDENFRTIEGKFSTVNTGIAHITALLTNQTDESEQD